MALSLDTDNPSPKLYALNSRWPSAATLEELADTSYFRSLFSRSFDTFILNAFRPGRSASYWREEFTSEDERAEEECFASLFALIDLLFKIGREIGHSSILIDPLLRQ